MRRATQVAVCAALVACTSASAVLTAATALARFEGKPQFKEGKAFGYFVWKEGDTWKVRWTTFGAERRFTGNVTLEGGQITSLEPIDVDSERRVIAPGRPARVTRGPRGRTRVRPGRSPVVAERDEDRIVQDDERRMHFNTVTDDDIDGFDLKVNDRTRQLRFRLEIDGRMRSQEIEVGARNVHPEEDPVVVILR